MKKIKFLLFTLFICMLTISGVSAAKRITCKYQQGHRNYKVTYNINGTSTVLEKILLTTDHVTDSEVTDTYRSWFEQSITENGSCKDTITHDGVKLSLMNKGNLEEEDLGPSQCYNYPTESDCKLSQVNGNVACVWVENEDAPNGGYCNVDNLLYVGCGGASDIPKQVPSLISLLVNLLKIATPIILIFISIITLLKAMAAQKEDEIKKAQSSLIKKIIAAALVFFVVAIVQFIVSVVAEEEYSGFENCLDCFLNNKCDTTTYYKTVVNGEDMCTYLTTGVTDKCSDMFSD